ncbi:MAG: hypothetical protein EA387_04890 [Nitriliruptor sp.]|nr:MAG: hypothetical protein EA387_04890 [Nitriliruptor sp.]
MSTSGEEDPGRSGPGEGAEPLATPPARTFRTPLRGHAFAGPTPPEALEADRPASVVREPHNPADPLAIAVWVEDGEGRPWRIGYLDRTVAARIAPRIDAGAEVRAVIEGWLAEPGGRWQRPLLRLEVTAGPGEATRSPETVHVEVWGRPPGVRRRRIDPAG